MNIKFTVSCAATELYPIIDVACGLYSYNAGWNDNDVPVI